MDEFLKKRLRENSFSYKMSLERIIDKYSKPQYKDGGMELDLVRTSTPTIERYMRLSRMELNKLESERLMDLSQGSIRSQDVTTDSQFNFTHHDGGDDESCVSSTSQLSVSVEDDGTARSDTTHLTVSSSDESQRSISEVEVQPEDQDEELEMTLRSHGSSLVELYPSMISRIGRAWHRQHVSNAADSVLRRYRRLRQQSNRSNLSNTFIDTLKHSRNPKDMTLLKESSPVRRQFMGPETTPRSPRQMVTKMQDWQARQLSPGRVRREEHQSVLVMDLSGLSQPREDPLNKTYTVSEVSWLGERPSTNTLSPSRPCYPSSKPSLDQSHRSKRLSLTAHPPQTNGCSTYATESTSARERPVIYSSPVRQSPSQARTSLSRSPRSFSRSPKAPSSESFSREPVRPRLISTPPQKPAVPLRTLYPQDSTHSLHTQLRSPQSASAAGGRHSLRRHHSFDSSLPSIRILYSPKKLEEDFLKLYHKFVCQNKSSFFNGHPCRLCARSSEASRGPSSSALAALALSPHRSLLRKRHRELDWRSHPQSKRSRDEYCTSSPGSKRHGREMLRRRLSASEYERDGLSYSSMKHSSTQQRSADAHQESWMNRRRHVSAADFSGMGSSLESRMTTGSSPRKW